MPPFSQSRPRWGSWAPDSDVGWGGWSERVQPNQNLWLHWVKQVWLSQTWFFWAAWVHFPELNILGQSKARSLTCDCWLLSCWEMVRVLSWASLLHGKRRRGPYYVILVQPLTAWTSASPNLLLSSIQLEKGWPSFPCRRVERIRDSKVFSLVSVVSISTPT